jgi:pyruvate-ferredoxin/flavodoxin oxidoreductase
MDMALIGQAASLASRVPFLHFFDGFRTSHEVQKIEQLTDEDIRTLVTDDLVSAHRARAMSPDRPVLRGTAQNPDVFFQARENVMHSAAPGSFRRMMVCRGGGARLFQYWSPDTER